ncbi:MAG: TIGR04282 family arsenosugar biosynthesis glycosyltransferase [Rubrivivax sp.]
MAKAPVAGLAKTRLAPALGAAGAAALARRLLDHAVAQAAAAQPASITLWVAPDASHPAFADAHRRHGARLCLQPAGDLGMRMTQVFSAGFAVPAARDRAETAALPLLLTGTDAPALDAAMLQRAASELATHDAVFVPALDGGYALVGLAHAAPALLTCLFDGMQWSHPAVMAQTRQRLQSGGWRHAELPPVSDIDEPADLAQLPAGLIDGAAMPD